MEGPAATPRGDGGFSLLEVVVSVVILAYGVLGMAGTTLYVVRQASIADVTAKQMMAVQSVVEHVRAEPFDTVGSRSSTIGAYAVSWVTELEGTRAKALRVVTTGPGLTDGPDGLVLSPAAVDTFVYRMVRP